MDLPLRTRLLIALVGIVTLSGLLTIVTGSFLIKRMVIGEAQRRVDLALKTADAMLERRLEEALRACVVMAEKSAVPWLSSPEEGGEGILEELRRKCGYDFLHVLDDEGVIRATARGKARGVRVEDSPVVSRVLREGSPAAGVSLLPLEALTLEDEAVAELTQVEISPTPYAKPGGPDRLEDVMILEVASPVTGSGGQVLGVVRGGTVINRNFDFVDFVRENIFTAATYDRKNLGTVTIFQSDVRITTNVVGPDGERAVGTRVSEEVYDQVLGQGKTWTGPAFVVDSWYISAYKPLRDIEGHILGMLYVGVLKKRYDDMRNQAMNLFILVAALAFVGAVLLSFWLAARIARPLTRLTAGAAEVTRGNLDYQLPHPPRADKDEINRLTLAFNQMVSALKERNEQLRKSRDDLQRTANELEQWVKNYLEALEFINHELKNQIAAQRIDAILEEVIELMQPMAEQNSIRIERRFAGELPPIEADREELIRLFTNLLSNAVKYNKPKGRIEIAAEKEGPFVKLRFADTGIGISEEGQKRLFTEFFREKSTEATHVVGTGLGLSIVKSIVDFYHGRIDVESEFGKGSVFTVWLPFNRSPASSVGSEKRNEGRRGSPAD